MQGNIRGQAGGGFDINGIIEEYTVASGGNVNAGDFVKFVNEIGTDTAINSSTTYTGNVISAVALSKNKVFIAHSYDKSNNYLYGMVCTINGTVITMGADTQLNATNNTGYAISAVALSENKVFIAYRYYYQRNYYMCEVVCTIDGTTITKGIDTYRYHSNNISNYTISAVALSENKVFIAYGFNDSSNYYLIGIICTIDGTTITEENNTYLSTAENTNYCMSAVALTENKVFIAHSYGRYTELYGIACIIDGITITKGTDTKLYTSVSYNSANYRSIASSINRR